MSVRLEWRGQDVLRKLERATTAAIDDVTGRAAQDARSNHWWKSRTRRLAGEVENEPAKRVGRLKVRGRFGTTKTRGFYGLFHERRTPFLRPAADRHFPRLAREIKRRMP